MTPTEEFESLLKDVVNAKRLSASKMTNLTDLAMKNMDNDNQLVSILYRTHKSLLPASAKIWSLYVFDALSRAAKSHIVKNNISGDISTQPGNAATFLLKVGGVVEGLFQDMIASGNSEAKEKTKKIYDIWVKGNTFPSSILAQLSEVLKGTDEVPVSRTPPAAPPMLDAAPASEQITSVAAPPAVQVPVVDPKAALLALLTQAAATSSTVSSQQQVLSTTPQLDPNQLAFLQQLAHTAASVPSVPQSLPIAEAVNVQNIPSFGVNGSSRPPLEARAMVTNEQRYAGLRSPEHESRTNSHFDDRDNMRGRYRGGGLRGRGRGDRFGRTWDGRDYRPRDSERDARSPRSYRGGRDRSKSPPRSSDKWNSRYISPPRRSRDASPPSRLRDASTGRENEPGKDEFGRDIRPGSPKSPVLGRSPAQPPTSPPRPIVDPRNPKAITANAPHSTHDENPVTHLASNTFSSTAIATHVSDSMSSELGLESFNPATFVYTSATSWEALGKMWQVTYGGAPSQEQLVQFVISYGTFQSPDQDLQQQSYNSFRGRGRGRGGYHRGNSYGNSRGGMEGEWGFEDNSETHAIVLGGGDNEDKNDSHTNNDQRTPESAQQSLQNQSTVSGAGRMQKIGDNWLFVRGVAGNMES